MSDGWESQPLQYNLEAAHNQQVQAAQQKARGVIAEYMAGAEFQALLQNLAKAVIFCICGLIGLCMICMAFPDIQKLLYAFFRFILIPVKPLLVSNPSEAIAGVWKIVTFVCHILNLIIVPFVLYFAFRCSKLPSFLYITEDGIYTLEKSGNPISEKAIWIPQDGQNNSGSSGRRVGGSRVLAAQNAYTERIR